MRYLFLFTSFALFVLVHSQLCSVYNDSITPFTECTFQSQQTHLMAHEYLIAINETMSYHSFMVKLDVQTGQPLSLPENDSSFNMWIQQGIGGVCTRMNQTLLYVFGQASFSDGSQIDAVLGIDTTTGILKERGIFPFTPMQVQGYGHTLTVDPTSCVVYSVGHQRSAVTNYTLQHVLYRYDAQYGPRYLFAFGDVGNYGDSLVDASAFDPYRRNLWMLQGFLSIDGDIRLFRLRTQLLGRLKMMWGIVS